MKFILILFLLFSCLLSHAIPKDSVTIIKKKEVYTLMDHCNGSIQWEEVILKDSVLQHKINFEIRMLIQSLKIDSFNFESICDGTHRGWAESRIVYSENNLISIFFEKHYVYPNYKNSTDIRTLNYSLKTGKPIIFQELFKPEKEAAIDSIILAEMKKWYEEFEMDFGNDALTNTHEQLKNAAFSIEDTRIVLYMIGSHCAYCTNEDPAVVFDYNEYKNFLNKKLLKNY